MYGAAPLWQANLNSSGNLQTAQYHYITTDHLGTPVLATNQSGSVTWRAQTEAFGRTIPDSQNQITMNLRFPGQYYDAETQTHYNYYRDYNPQTGRYVQRDPIGLQGGINAYGYVNADFTNYIDPYGLFSSLNGCVTSPAAMATCAEAGIVAGTATVAVGIVIESNRTISIDDELVECTVNFIYENHDYIRVEYWFILAVKAIISSYQTKTPNTGEPNSTHENPENGQERTYGEDGKPIEDIDWNHNHGQGVPHRHPCDRGPNGEPIRGPGVPIPYSGPMKPTGRN